jgi:purine nucleoside permease
MSTRLLTLLVCILSAASALAAVPAPIPVKVVVIALFEPGADRGDTPGEYQYWVEREHLDHVFAFPQGFHDLRMNDQGVMGVLAGVGTARAAASIMALGLDPRFDFSKTYWLIAGISGADPEDASLGSAVWAEWVVDGDLAYEIDSREIPPQWTTGYVPLNKTKPYEQPRDDDHFAMFHLNPDLVEWAYQQTKAVKLDDSPQLEAARAHFAGASARRPPFVLKGDTLSASTFWHGKLLDQWANQWVSYHTDGKGNFVTSAMEDTGVLQSLTFLHHAGRVDLDRVMVLRTVSNFDQPPTGLTAAESLAASSGHRYSAYLPALEAAYRVGNVVVSEIVTNWDRYQDRIPGSQLKEKP